MKPTTYALIRDGKVETLALIEGKPDKRWLAAMREQYDEVRPATPADYRKLAP